MTSILQTLTMQQGPRQRSEAMDENSPSTLNPLDDDLEAQVYNLDCSRNGEAREAISMMKARISPTVFDWR